MFPSSVVSLAYRCARTHCDSPQERMRFVSGFFARFAEGAGDDCDDTLVFPPGGLPPAWMRGYDEACEVLERAAEGRGRERDEFLAA